MHTGLTRWVCIGMLITSTGCRGENRASSVAGDGPDATPAAPGVVDSIFPMPEMIARFQQQVPAISDSLQQPWSPSRDALLERLREAVVKKDAAALRSLRIDVAEYAYLYFPTSPNTAPPYASPPPAQWQLTDQGSLKGERLLLQRLGGRALPVTGLSCAEPRTEGRNRLWSCHALLADPGADPDAAPDTVRLFGSIIERDGRFKFLSLANDL